MTSVRLYHLQMKEINEFLVRVNTGKLRNMELNINSLIQWELSFLNVK